MDNVSIKNFFKNRTFIFIFIVITQFTALALEILLIKLLVILQLPPKVTVFSHIC